METRGVIEWCIIGSRATLPPRMRLAFSPRSTSAGSAQWRITCAATFDPPIRGAMKDAFVVAERLGIASKSRERDRRPTLEEFDKIMEYFGERLKRRPSSIPMQMVIGFAIFSTRRLEEITRILWKDLDVEGSRILVRDMKNSGEKIENDVWCDLPPEVLQIILLMPRRCEELFPYCGDTIGTNFTRACQFLNIIDLHLHDLRHDGVSKLFEMGRSHKLSCPVIVLG